MADYPELNPSDAYKAQREAEKAYERATGERRARLLARKCGLQSASAPVAAPAGSGPQISDELRAVLEADARANGLLPKSGMAPVMDEPGEADGYEGDQLDGTVDADDRDAVNTVILLGGGIVTES